MKFSNTANSPQDESRLISEIPDTTVIKYYKISIYPPTHACIKAESCILE